MENASSEELTGQGTALSASKTTTEEIQVPLASTEQPDPFAASKISDQIENASSEELTGQVKTEELSAKNTPEETPQQPLVSFKQTREDNKPIEPPAKSQFQLS